MSQSEADKIRADRDKIRIDVWDDQSQQGNSKEWCFVCRTKLKFKITDEGLKLECRSCGMLKPVDEVKHEKKLISRAPVTGRTGPIILSQSFVNKKRRHFMDYDSVNSGLNEEDLNDLRQAGLNI